MPVLIFGQNNSSPDYLTLMDGYRQLEKDYPGSCTLMEAGNSDGPYPIHTFVIAESGSFDPEAIRAESQLVCLINNGIHPGEPCGINASLDFAREKAAAPDAGVVYVIVPVYNIGGMLNRGAHSRANQDGPVLYGFRGNMKNLDLNRDFIKSDSENAKTFATLFHLWKPAVFIDTHTTNGADYQPVMTLISPSTATMPQMQASFVNKEMIPYLYKQMKASGDEMIPYVNLKGETPEEGIVDFIDLPRYSTGYVGLFNCIGFTSEAHMLKPFDARVQSTLNLLHVLDTFLIERHDVILEIKRVADEQTKSMTTIDYDWKLSDESEPFNFPGFEADYKTSEVTGQQQLSYDRNQPYRKDILFYKTNIAQQEAELPENYVVPQGWIEIIELLELNGIVMTTLADDQILKVKSTYVTSFETSDVPYEGHYMHSNTKVSEKNQEVKFYKGDFIISTNQVGNRYLAHVLEPGCEDSFFNWNFFDSILMQKEYYSAYLFDTTAQIVLERNKNLKDEFEQRKKDDPAFAQNAMQQLDFIYENSEYFERVTLKRLPIFKASKF